MLILLIACSSEPPPPPAPTPEAPPAPEVVYVQASTLNLRESPDPAARRAGRLAINDHVEVLERTEGWARVKTGNGKEAWVSAEFLAKDPLTADTAWTRASAAPEAERLSWLQRAAALDPRREHLEALKAEYLRLGEGKKAAIIDAQLAFPKEILPVAGFWDGKVWVELHSTYEPPEGIWSRISEGDGRATAAELKAARVPFEGKWWALPDAGPAVEATPGTPIWESINECSGASGIHLPLTVPGLDPDRTVVAVYHGEKPPPTWLEAGPMPGISRADAEAQALRLARERGAPEDTVVRLGVEGEGWRFTASWQFMDWEIGEPLPAVTGWVGPGGQSRASEGTAQWLGGNLAATRDVDGDGRPEGLYLGCAGEIRDATGAVVATTEFACCGC